MITQKTVDDLKELRALLTTLEGGRFVSVLDEALVFLSWKCPDCKDAPMQIREFMGKQAAYCSRCKRVYAAARWLDPDDPRRAPRRQIDVEAPT